MWTLKERPSLVDASVVFMIDEMGWVNGNAISSSPSLLIVPAVNVKGAGTAAQIPVFELSADQTRMLKRFGPRVYRYQIRATWPTHRRPIVLVEGDVSVVGQYEIPMRWRDWSMKSRSARSSGFYLVPCDDVDGTRTWDIWCHRTKRLVSSHPTRDEAIEEVERLNEYAELQEEDR
jgi:hypothetical protein